MSLWSKLRLGAEYVQQGDFDPIVEYFLDTAERSVLSVPKGRPASAPAGVDTETPCLLFWDRTADYEAYHRVVADDRFVWDAPVPVESVAFTLAGVHSADTARVSVTFVAEDDRRSESSFRFTDGEFNDRSVIPVEFTAPFPATEVIVEVDADTRAAGPSSTLTEGEWSSVSDAAPRASVPSGTPATDTDGHPIFLISVDSLRFDHLDALGELRDALGEDAVVPTEPRTQGIQTWQSHGSMFTGVHPGRHGCYGAAPSIPSSVTTVAEFLESHGYRASGVAAGAGLLPEFGYGRGFHRYERREMSWETREFDARSNVNTVIDWVESDAQMGDGHGFYFLHIFDPHYPYLPPLPAADCEELDYEAMSSFVGTDQAVERFAGVGGEESLDVDPHTLELAKTYYRESVEYVGRQVSRLVDRLKSLGLFGQSFVVVTGDHGEEFGERNRLFHRTLHDVNIRPGMIVKPPADSDIVVPDDPDLIDFFPTVAELLGESVPGQCAGRPWVESRQSGPRFTESFADDYYLSVESDGYKGLLLFESDDRSRPDESQLADGPLDALYCVPAECRDDPSSWTETDVPAARRESLRELAREFVLDSATGTEGAETAVPADVQDRLADLGYT